MYVNERWQLDKNYMKKGPYVGRLAKISRGEVSIDLQIIMMRLQRSNRKKGLCRT